MECAVYRNMATVLDISKAVSNKDSIDDIKEIVHLVKPKWILENIKTEVRELSLLPTA